MPEAVESMNGADATARETNETQVAGAQGPQAPKDIAECVEAEAEHSGQPKAESAS